MNFDSFAAQLSDDLKASFPEAEFTIQHIAKPQRQSYTGIAAKPAKQNIGAVINIDAIYQRKLSGTPYDELLQGAVQEVTDAFCCIPTIQADMPTDYSKLKSSLTLQLIPQKGNEKILSECPNREIADLALLYRFRRDHTNGCASSVLITHSVVNSLEVSAEQIIADAERIAPETNPATFRSLTAVMRELAGGDLDLPETPFWVASTERNEYGAAVLAYPEFLDNAATKLGGSFYILPSSVHELLFLPYTERMNAAELNHMVSSVNATELTPDEVLSDTAYLYDASERTLTKLTA